MKKKAVVTGLTGQDGYFLSRLLLNKGYEVHAIVRSFSCSEDSVRYIPVVDGTHFDFCENRIFLHLGDLTDSNSIMRIIQTVRPDEIYNLAGISSVKLSYLVPEAVMNSVAVGTLRILETIKNLNLIEKTRFFQASSSEIFGNPVEFPQTENTPVNPCSPYAIAKSSAHFLTKFYREAYRLYAVNGILYNHESERRGNAFVTRKITSSVAKIAAGKLDVLRLGNLDAKRDWGYAKNYVECMWRTLQHEQAEDFIIASGIQHSVREFCEVSFKNIGIDISWTGRGLEEKGIDSKTGKVLIEVDPVFFRDTDINANCGDSSKAVQKLGWNPGETSFEELVSIMVKNDLAEVSAK